MIEKAAQGTLHVYPQHVWHDDVYIVGNRAALELLVEAVQKALADPELLASAKQAKLPVDYIPGDEVAKLVASALNQPPEVVNLVKEIVKSGGGGD